MNARKRRLEAERQKKLQQQLQQSKMSSSSSNANNDNIINTNRSPLNINTNTNIITNPNTNVPRSSASNMNNIVTSPNNYTLYTGTETNRDLSVKETTPQNKVENNNPPPLSKAQMRNSLRMSMPKSNSIKDESIKSKNINEIIDQSPPRKPTENEKLVQLTKMIKMFNLNVSAENIQINENSIYSKSRKEIIELQDKIKLEEKNLNILTNSIKNSTQNYIEKIISLQNQLLNSPKGDIISLEEANKIDDVQVNNLLDTLYRVNDEYEREKEEINNLVSTQIEPIQDELRKEIKEVQNLKKELMKYKGKTIPLDIKKKLEVVLKFKTQV